MKKPKTKARRWNCKGKTDDKGCKNRAMIETDTRIGIGNFSIPLKVKLCVYCSRSLSGLLATLTTGRKVLGFLQAAVGKA